MFADLRFALRQLLKSPGFTATAILTLALGIGACTAIFSVVNGVLLRPLDYPAPDRIVVIKETNLPSHPEFSVSPPNFLDWRKQARSFAFLAAAAGQPLNLTGDGEPQRLFGARVTADFFAVYGVKPVLGRTFLPEEDAPGKNHVVVLSHAFWQRAFAGSPDAVGRTLQLNGEPHTIVGIAPPNFGVQNKFDAWVPMAFSPEESSNDYRGAHYLNVTGRLAPGVTAASADAELKLLAAQLARQYSDSNKGWGAFVTPLQDYSVRDVRTVLYTLLGAVGCVLLIACANIANLLLARATARHRELSIRAALGAGRARLIRQLLTESVVLAVLGGGAGVLVAQWGLAALLRLAPANLPRSAEIHLDAAVLAFALVLSVATGLLFGLMPAWLAARANVSDALKQGARGSTDAGARGRFRAALVVAEVAAAVVLLAAAGLLVRSFGKLAHVDSGFRPENAIVVRLTVPEKKYPEPAQQAAFAEAVLARFRALPGVDSVGVANTLPLVGDWVLSFEIEGRPPIPASDQPDTNYYAVSPDYFRAMGIRLAQGRTFTARDDAKAPHVAIINETFARLYFPNQNPLGQRINVTNGPQTWREIVGIVADVKQAGPDRATTAQAYEPFAQKPHDTFNFVLRTTGAPAALLSSLRPVIYAVDHDQPVGSVQPLEEILSGSIARQRFATLLLTVFSLVALLIAAIGIYGVMAYSVTQRTSELGIRAALGAQPADILRLIFLQGGRLIALGLALGVIATLAGGRLIASLLFQTSAADPLTLAATTLLLAAVAALACFIPARRATKIDPLTALRAE